MIVDAVKDPLADIAFEMQKEVANGVLMRPAALPDLLLVEFAKAGGNVAVKRLHLSGGVGEEVRGDGVL